MTQLDDDGLGIIEVVIAMFLFMLIAVAVLPLTMQAVASSAQNRDLLAATSFAKQQLTTIQAGYPATPGSTSGSCAALRALQTAPPAVDAANDFRAQVTVGVCPGAYPASVPVRVTVTHDGDTVTSVTTRVRVGASSRTPLRRDDDGLTLVELIIVMLVSGLFLSLIAVIFGSGLSAQQRAAERNAATGALNAATAAITETVRSSSEIRVSAGGRRLDAQMLTHDGAAWECRAWQVLDGELRYSAGATPRPAADTGWSSLASEVTGSLSGGTAFVENGKRLSLGFALTSGDITVTVTDGANAQVIAQTGGTPCW
ncbi:prepilin-type N-terminal cleavage/methylation domain-containing protein [Microbacterium sp. KUDC0406]|uniref:prepilin-type N-terminal cleavage/methylation domain-containing protein n=1 Tax=Microbacterium sp. KUDC0406 TaxID=2909588 RepID=UPI001F2C779B|nr:prepilin-type N-terminal cleavage/methylation domain-containing protein [Microbacterium sp. KUDC0406]UJP10274.1 prepilin-type N-terminal cleavage/methylation domain-containing protein [Microbacterium sp. KUDC0406]